MGIVSERKSKLILLKQNLRSKHKPEGLLFCMVPVAGLEPARCRHRGILSPKLYKEHSGTGWHMKEFYAPWKWRKIGVLDVKIFLIPVKTEKLIFQNLKKFLHVGGILEGYLEVYKVFSYFILVAIKNYLSDKIMKDGYYEKQKVLSKSF